MAEGTTFLVCRHRTIEHYGFPSEQVTMSACSECETMDLSMLLLNVAQHRQYNDGLKVHSQDIVDAFCALAQLEAEAPPGAKSPICHMLDICEQAVPLFEAPFFDCLTEDQVVLCLRLSVTLAALPPADILLLADSLSAKGYKKAVALLVEKRMSK